MRILEDVKNSITIERSEFICYLRKCLDESECRTFISEIRKLHSDATHVCTAFITSGTSVQRSSDDGEPSGTAGMPILEVLKKNDMSDICCCVVRYFGGIKLGAGGLIRAYSKATSSALSIAKLATLELRHIYSITFSYDLINKMNYILENKADILDKSFDVDVTYIVSSSDDIENLIVENTNGKYHATFVEDKYIEVPYGRESL